ncbi:Las1-domain-containing protein [Dentipellis sp. KUC8613]|nr:Las1-domain-containing protein [Dentipellis sp. KUC8613]
MRLPRRTPWASLTELDQLCSWVYTDENDWDSKTLAVQRLSAWKAITTLPHALESLLALLVALLHDNAQQASTSTSSTSTLSLRQSYATAVIRLVNGLVDPLQVGAYARSISSIAAQLGLPAWLVELRHAATHEDLPSLELLRDAARESLAWLLHHYFLPTLNPTLQSQSQSQPHGPALRPLVPALKQYKTLQKLTTRDASLRSRYAADTTKLVRDVERWIAEARVAANMAEWAAGADEAADGEERKERWALERLCDALLEKGILVPMSKRKRAPVKGSLLPNQPSLALWTSLLEHLIAHHPMLPSVLLSRIIAHLTAEQDALPGEETSTGTTAPRPHQDPSYDLCLASWAMWLMAARDTEANGVPYRDHAFLMLTNGLGPRLTEVTRTKSAALTLFDALCASDPQFAAVKAVIVTDANSPSEVRQLLHHQIDSSVPNNLRQQWDEKTISIMDERLKVLLSLPSDEDASGTATPAVEETASAESAKSAEALPPGWRLLTDSDGWKPCPIGVF